MVAFITFTEVNGFDDIQLYGHGRIIAHPPTIPVFPAKALGALMDAFGILKINNQFHKNFYGKLCT